MNEVRTHRYPRSALRNNALLAVVGLALVAGLLVAVPHSLISGALIGFGAVLVLHLIRTILWALSRIEVSVNAIVVRGPMGREVRWDALTAVRLNYYTTRRARQGRRKEEGEEERSGWMQLILKGEGRTIRLESTLEGFDSIAERAARAVRERNLAVTPVTAHNFEALGLPVDGPR